MTFFNSDNQQVTDLSLAVSFICAKTIALKMTFFFNADNQKVTDLSLAACRRLVRRGLCPLCFVLNFFYFLIA